MQSVCVCPGQNTLYLYIHAHTLHIRGSVLTEELRYLKVISYFIETSLVYRAVAIERFNAGKKFENRRLKSTIHIQCGGHPLGQPSVSKGKGECMGMYMPRLCVWRAKGERVSCLPHLTLNIAWRMATGWLLVSLNGVSNLARSVSGHSK